MTQPLNLMLHCGANAVQKGEVIESSTPAPTDTHYPIPHGKLLGLVERTLEHGGLSVVSEAHGLTHDGNRYFGMLHVTNGQQDDDDYGLIVGVRNSHDKSFPAALALGSQVFVCDNLSFSGEVKIARKHTRFITRDLPRLVHRAVGLLSDHRDSQSRRFDLYRESELSNAEAHDLTIAALDGRVIAASKIPAVLEEWRNPQHEEFEPRTAWSQSGSSVLQWEKPAPCRRSIPAA